jgi:colanic acid/amylovoran biosynthesis glycosyltransferase
MRTAFCLWRFPDVAEPYVLDEIAGLVEAGHDVSIFAFTQGDREPLHEEVARYGLLERTTFERRSRSRAGKALVTAAQLGSLAITRPGIARATLQGPARTFATRVRAAAQFRALRDPRAPFDVIYPQPGDVGTFIAPLLVSNPARFAVGFQGGDMYRFGERSAEAYRAAFAQASLVLVPSEWGRRRLEEIGCPRERIRVVPTATDERFFTFNPHPRKPGEPLRLLSVGRLAPMKGYEYAVRAVASIAAAEPVSYTIAGPDGPAAELIRALIGELGLEGTVRLAGPVARAGVRDLMREAHVFLLPSVTDAAAEKETASVVAREASSSGLPIVASTACGNPEFVLDGVTGFLVPERDPGAIAGAIRQFIAAPELIDTLGRNGRERVCREFTLAVRVRRLDALFRGLES